MAESDSSKQDTADDQKEKSSLDDLSTEELKQRIKKYLFYLKDMKKKCADLKEECTMLEQERDAANEVILKWQSENKTEQIAELQYRIKELKREIDHLSSGKSAADEELVVLMTARDTALEALKKMKNALTSSQIQIEQLTKNENELKSQLEVKNEVELKKIKEIQNLIDKYDDLSEKHEKFQNSFATLKSQFECLMKEKDEIYAENQELQEIKAQCAEIQKANDTLQCENVSLKQNIEEINHLNSSLSENCTKLTEDNKLLTERNSNLQTDKEGFMHIVEECLRKITKNSSLTCKDNNNFIDEFNLIYKKYEEFEQQSIMITQAQDALLKLSCFSNDTVSLPSNLLQLSEIICRQFQDFKSKVEDLEQKKLDKQTMENETNSKIEMLETNVKSLEQKLAFEVAENRSVVEKLEKDYENLQKSCKSLEVEREKLVSENTNIKVQCNDMLREISVTTNIPTTLLQLPHFEEENGQLFEISEIKRLICDCYSELKIKLDTFENEKQDENSSGNKKIKELENEITNLSSKLEESYSNTKALIEELNTCRHDKESVTKENVEISEKNKELLNGNKTLLQEINDTKQFLSCSSCFKDNVEINSMQLKEMCEFISKCFEELEIKFNELEKNNSDGKHVREIEIAELKKQLKELQLKFDLCSQENESLRADLDHYKIYECEKLQFMSEISDLKEKSEALNQQNYTIETVQNILLDLLIIHNKEIDFSNLIKLSHLVFNEHVELKENFNVLKNAKLNSEAKLNDYNNIEKNLLELTSEKALMTEKYDELLHITQSLKDELMGKDQQILQLSAEITNVKPEKDLVDVHVQASTLLCDMSIGMEYISSEVSSQTDIDFENQSLPSPYAVTEWGCTDVTINAPVFDIVSNNIEPVQTSSEIHSSSISSQTEENSFKVVCCTSSQTDSNKNPELPLTHPLVPAVGITEWGCIDDVYEKNETSDNMEDSMSRGDANSVQRRLIKVGSECDVEIQTDIVATEIENVLKENDDLKLQLETKSKLVGDIQNLLNSRLEKEEELTTEISIIKSDFERANQRNKLLEQEQIQLLETNKSLKEDLRTLKALSVDLQVLKGNITTDFTNFKSEFIAALTDTSHNLFSKCDIYANVVHNLKNEIKHYKICLEDIIHNIGDIVELFLQTDLVHFPNTESMHTNSKTLVSFLESGYSQFEIECFNTFKECLGRQTKEIKLSIEQIFSGFSDLVKLKEEQESECNKLKDSVIPALEQQIQELGKLSETSHNQNSSEKIEVQNSSDESLQGKIAETEVKMNKFKALAIRLKKELVEYQNKYKDCNLEKEKYRKQVEDISEELDRMSTTHSKYVLNFQNLQSDNDKLQDECEDLKSTIKMLQVNLSNIQADFDKCKANLQSVENELLKANQQNSSSEIQKKDVEGKISNLEGKIIILEAKNVEEQNKIKDLLSELTKSRNEITDLMKEKESLLQKLDDALKEGKQHNLIDLEMADYQRSIEELTNQLEKKNMQHEELINDNETLKARIDTLQAEIKICENHKDTEEKRAEGFKEALESTKKELMLLRETETELRSNFVQANLRLEALGQKQEEYKAEISNQTAEIERLKEMMGNSVKNHDRIVRSLKSKISSQEQNILMAHKEVESVKQDFENYKIRVHSVLKQQKNVGNVMPSDDEEKQNLEAQVEKFKMQIKEISDKLLAVTLEKETLQEEYNHLLQRNDNIMEELTSQDKNWNTKLEQVNQEKLRLQLLLQDTISEHETRNEIIKATYKKQIKNIQEEHKNSLKSLQAQLEAADVKIANLELECQKNCNFVQSSTNQEETFSFDILSQERQEGEGSECNENINIKPLSLATIPSSGFLPLDKLLQSPADSDKSFSFTSLPDPEKLTIELNASTKKLDHLRELLNESEANNMRQGEQVRVLKEEVRRLERNKQRTEHEENLEYLKNVFVKFVTLDPGSERTRLIPVITTMLKLSPDEQQRLKNVAGDSISADTSSSWGSYLHRWSGT